jgi:hypothetical protein
MIIMNATEFRNLIANYGKACISYGECKADAEEAYMTKAALALAEAVTEIFKKLNPPEPIEASRYWYIMSCINLALEEDDTVPENIILDRSLSYGKSMKITPEEISTVMDTMKRFKKQK